MLVLTQNFFCERVGDECGLNTNHEYYAQVQGQLAITGAAWCDFVVKTFKGMSIQRITFDDLVELHYPKYESF